MSLSSTNLSDINGSDGLLPSSKTPSTHCQSQSSITADVLKTIEWSTEKEHFSFLALYTLSGSIRRIVLGLTVSLGVSGRGRHLSGTPHLMDKGRRMYIKIWSCDEFLKDDEILLMTLHTLHWRPSLAQVHLNGVLLLILASQLS